MDLVQVTIQFVIITDYILFDTIPWVANYYSSSIPRDINLNQCDRKWVLSIMLPIRKLSATYWQLIVWTSQNDLCCLPPWMLPIPLEWPFSFIRSRKFFYPSNWNLSLFDFLLGSPGIHPSLQLHYCYLIRFPAAAPLTILRGWSHHSRSLSPLAMCYQSHQLFVIWCGWWATGL